MKKIIISIGLFIALTTIGLACRKEIPMKQDTRPAIPNKPESYIEGYVSDPEGHEYKWRLMKDGKIWLLNNMAYNIPDSSWWYETPWYDIKYLNVAPKHESCGLLYYWQAAKNACAILGKKWRLPDNSDWDGLLKAYRGGLELTRVVNGNSIFGAAHCGKKLKNINTGSNVFGGMSINGFFWSATEIDLNRAWIYSFNSIGIASPNDGLLFTSKAGIAYSCRCVMDA